MPLTDDVPDFLRHSRPIMPVRAPEEFVLGDEELVQPARPQPQPPQTAPASTHPTG
ncbi:MAG: hypothetical protein IPL78_12665 [Chloroflexi bacterium]|nr:hypothetical protein [Chloroflexota bacterium]